MKKVNSFATVGYCNYLSILFVVNNCYGNQESFVFKTAVHGWASERAQLVGRMVLSIRLTLVNHEHVLAHLNRTEQLILFSKHFA